MVRKTGAYPYLILTASFLFFYWSSGSYTLLLLASITLNFCGAIAIETWRRRRTLCIIIGLNLAILVYYKYTFFALSTVGFFGSEAIAEFAKSVILPIGISFFTFQGISYVVDVWRNDVKAERNFAIFAAYKAFFPQLIAGPIVRYVDVHNDFHRPKVSLDMFAAGAARFMVGLCKKVLIADSVAVIANAAFSIPDQEVTFVSAWLGAVAYTIQIYFDFSGYSDMAIGLAMMFGIRFMENFNHPYAASTITEFWRRWHISLSSWFRDYLYIPLGGNRKGISRTYINLLVVFLATGIWHGAAWTFVLWGVYHGVFLIGERVFLKGANVQSTSLRILYFFPTVILGWVLFRSEDIGQFSAFFKAMLTPFAVGSWAISPAIVAEFTPIAGVSLILSSILVLLQGATKPFGPMITDTKTLIGHYTRLAFVFGSAVACTMFVLPQSFSPFLYFRF